MSRVLATALALVFLLASAFPAGANDSEPKAPANPEAAAVVPGEVVVKWRDAAAATEQARNHGLALVAELGVPGKGFAASVHATKGRPVETVIAELEADPAVEYAEPNYVVSLPDHEVEGGVADDAGDGQTAAVAVNDALTGGQYSLDRMRVRDAWSLSKGGSNVVAVLDTGVQANHPDLSGRVLRGHDFVNDDTNAADDNGHGTWVAGIIAANANDGYGIAGISWTDKILPVKIMNAGGTGATSYLTSGIVWAADQGADVINMSVGGFPYSRFVEDAVDYAWQKGAVLVAAAGNNNRREDFYPASYANVINVSATQREDEFSHWSSYGPKVDVSAPGSSVQTTNCTASACPSRGWGSHTYISGTSFATPNVAGVVALIKARYPSWTPSQIVSRVYSTVDDLGYAGRDERYGRGRVNANRALGASVAAAPRPGGDGLEGNDTLASAKLIGLGATTRPSIYPAGDVDWFAVDVPRAGRLDVRVTGVVDTRAYPWNKSALPVDAIVELYTAAGSRITRVDSEWESGTELAQHSVSAATRILVRVSNYYANGNRTAYSVTPTFVDTVRPAVTSIAPGDGATEVTQWVVPVARFSERVKNVTTKTVRVRDTVTWSTVSGTVSYDSRRREVRFTPASRLIGKREYRFELGAGITDVAGNRLTATHVRFRTSDYAFSDIQGTTFAKEINWIADQGITTGCTTDRFCPTKVVDRGQMASFLARALALPSTTRDYFTDDDGIVHHPNINRIAAAGITTGCGGTRYCPKRDVSRGQMASFLARALQLPRADRDYFTDDNGTTHEQNINRLAAAGITTGCGGTRYCPHDPVTRQQMAAFLYRSFRR